MTNPFIRVADFQLLCRPNGQCVRLEAATVVVEHLRLGGRLDVGMNFNLLASAGVEIDEDVGKLAAVADDDRFINEVVLRAIVGVFVGDDLLGGHLAFVDEAAFDGSPLGGGSRRAHGHGGHDGGG
jgi:hypothetical protein